MVGTPQLPLKYRRKAGPPPPLSSGFKACAQQLALARLCASDSPAYSSDDALPQSPSSSYTSPMSSSPIRKAYTPEPPSSPLTDPYVLSSPRSTYEFPSGACSLSYEHRSSKFGLKQDISVNRTSWAHRRRSSSCLTAPTLVSDVEPSEYSDVDFSAFSDDAPEQLPMFRTSTRPSVKISDLLGPDDDMDPLESLRHRQNIELTQASHPSWNGELDIASALLDLSREVRITPDPVQSVSTSPTITIPSINGRYRSPLRSDPPTSDVRTGENDCPHIPDRLLKIEPESHNELSIPGVVASNDVTLAHICATSSTPDEGEAELILSANIIATPSSPAMPHAIEAPNVMSSDVPSTLLERDALPEMVAVQRGDGAGHAALVSDALRCVPADHQDSSPTTGNVAEDNINVQSNAAVSAVGAAASEATVDAVDCITSVTNIDLCATNSPTLSLCPQAPTTGLTHLSPSPSSEVTAPGSPLTAESKHTSEEQSHAPSKETTECSHDSLRYGDSVAPQADRESEISHTQEQGVSNDLEEHETRANSEDLSKNIALLARNEVDTEEASAAPSTHSLVTPPLAHDSLSFSKPVSVTDTATSTASLPSTPYPSFFGDAEDDDDTCLSVLSSPLTAVSSLPELEEIKAGPSASVFLSRNRSRSASSLTALSASSSRLSSPDWEHVPNFLDGSNHTAKSIRSEFEDAIKQKKASGRGRPRMKVAAAKAKAEKENKGLDGNFSSTCRKGKEREMSHFSEASSGDLFLDMEIELEDEVERCLKEKPRRVGQRVASKKRRKIEDDDEPSALQRASSPLDERAGRKSTASRDLASEKKDGDDGHGCTSKPKKRRKKQLYVDMVKPAALTPSDYSNPELRGLIIQTMALSRASSMPASSLFREILREQPQMARERTREGWIEEFERVLSGNGREVFGRVEREGLDAADKPLEALYFYIPENDEDQDRATLLREMMPKKRNETKKHKQYYYRPVGKLMRWEAEDDA